MRFHTYEDLCCHPASYCDPPIRGTTTTAHHEYDTNWTRRASGRPSVITGHNASALARPYRPFLEREIAGPSSSASCRASSADSRSQPTGVETVNRQPDGLFRPSVGTSEPRARLQRPLPSRITRTWMHPALQDESHPAAADFLHFISQLLGARTERGHGRLRSIQLRPQLLNRGPRALVGRHTLSGLAE